MKLLILIVMTFSLSSVYGQSTINREKNNYELGQIYQSQNDYLYALNRLEKKLETPDSTQYRELRSTVERTYPQLSSSQPASRFAESSRLAVTINQIGFDRLDSVRGQTIALDSCPKSMALETLTAQDAQEYLERVARLRSRMESMNRHTLTMINRNRDHLDTRESIGQVNEGLSILSHSSRCDSSINDQLNHEGEVSFRQSVTQQAVER